MTGTAAEVVPLRGSLSPEQRGARHWQGRLLRSLSLLLLAALPVAVPVAMYASGSLDLFRIRGILALLISILCPGLFLLMLLAKARTLRQEATERFWLVGSVLVVHDVDHGRHDYDLTRFPVTLQRQWLLSNSRWGLARGWVELRIGTLTDGGCAVTLSDRRSGAWWSPHDLRRIAAVLAGSPIDVSHRTAATLYEIAARLDLAEAATTPQGRRAHEALADAALEPAPTDPGSVRESSVPTGQPGPDGRGPRKEDESGPFGRAIGACIAALLGAALFLTGLTLVTLGWDDYPGRTGRTGHATVQSCERLGPVSHHGFGHWWRCQGEVRWEDGDTARFVEGRSRFTPADQGTAVPVEEGTASARYLSAERGPVPSDEGPAHGSLFISGVLLCFASLFGPLVLVAELINAGCWLVKRLRPHPRAAPG